jgi:drug/metabolite transporter (DMT)-like permease
VQSNKKIILTAVLVPLFWSLVFPLSKVVLSDLPPLTVVSLRYSLGAAFLTLVALSTRKGREMGILLRTKWPAMSALGFIAVVSNASQVIGLNYSSAAAGTIIASTAPIYSAVLGAAILRERIGINQVVGLILSLGDGPPRGHPGLASQGHGGGSGETAQHVSISPTGQHTSPTGQQLSRKSQIGQQVK